LVNITLNCQAVGFDIGCHEAINFLITNSIIVVEVKKTYSWHSYNGLVTANVKAKVVMMKTLTGYDVMV